MKGKVGEAMTFEEEVEKIGAAHALPFVARRKIKDLLTGAISAERGRCARVAEAFMKKKLWDVYRIEFKTRER